MPIRTETHTNEEPAQTQKAGTLKLRGALNEDWRESLKTKGAFLVEP